MLNLTILANIVRVALAGSLDSAALSAVVAVQKDSNAATTAAFRAAYAGTGAALAAALVPFGLAPADSVVTAHGDTSTVDTLCRVHGSRLVREA